MERATTIESCRACGSPALLPIMSLGELPLANSLVSPRCVADRDPRFPLDLVLCPACALVQITETVPRERLFREYLYFSSYSSTMVAHADALAARLVAERRLGGRSFVVELASNDGYLLQHFVRAGIDVLGVDPALNVAEEARRRDIPTLTEFFDVGVAERIAARRGRADVVLGLNVLAHVADLPGFVAGVERLLHRDGVAVFEVPDVCALVARRAFDTIYHEHLAYFSVTSLRNLLGRHGLALVQVEHLPIHGGSLRAFAAKAGVRAEHGSVGAALDEEARWGVASPDAYRPLGEGVASVRSELNELIDGVRAQGASVAAYGAAAKGTMLLNCCGLGTDRVGFVVDRNLAKQGHLVPGTRQPVRPVSALADQRPDYLLLLVWNLVGEVVDQQAGYRREGGRFIVPVPEPTLL